MRYAIHGFVLALIGLNLFAYYALTLQIKTISLLYRVNPYNSLLKLILLLLGAFYVWNGSTIKIYQLMQLHTWPDLMPGELLAFQASLELALLLVGAHFGAAIADLLIMLIEKGYHALFMAFIKATGLNLRGLAYTRVVKTSTLPPQVVSRGQGGGGRSPSMVAQEAIAKMEAAKKANRNADSAKENKQKAVRKVTSGM